MEIVNQEEKNPMQEKLMEKNRRKAFYGLQLKYTLAPILWLYGIVFAVLMGEFLYNWFALLSKEEDEITCIDQLGALPLEIAFFVLLIGVQVILGIGFAKQDRNELAMKRILFPKETKDMIRLNFSLLVTFSAFLFYFLLICLIGIMENVLAPEYAYGGTELFSVFYYFTHLYHAYPVVSVWAIPRFLVCVAAVAVIAPIMVGNSLELTWEFQKFEKIVWGMFIFFMFVLYCSDESRTPFLDFLCLLIFSGDYIVRVALAYWERQKADREETEENAAC